MADDKVTKFRGAIRDFHASDKSPDEYLELIVASHMVLRQGSGLTWGQIKDILNEELRGEHATG